MSPLTDVHDSIQQARQMEGPPWMAPWPSFAEFFNSRVCHPTVADRPFLTYHDDELNVQRRYTYAEFGRCVEQAAAFLHHRLGLTRGDRIATVLFNHDQTVTLYFAAWKLGLAVVPINVEEPVEKKRYILEHSEAAAVCCWPDYLDEVRASNATCRRFTMSSRSPMKDSITARGQWTEAEIASTLPPLAARPAPLPWMTKP